MGADSAVDSNGVSSGPFGIAVHFHEAEEAVVKYRIVDSSSMSGITNRLVHLLGMAINHNNGAFEVKRITETCGELHSVSCLRILY